MPSSHSCRCEKCWSLNIRCLGVCPSACGLDLSHCLAFQLAFKLRFIYAVPLFWFTLDRFLPCASIPVTVWVSLPLLTFCHGFGLCFAILPFALNFRSYDPDISWLLPFRRTLDFDCCNAVTQRGHQLLAGFQFEATEPTLHFELAELGSLRFGIFAQLLNWLQITSRLMTCDKGEKNSPARKNGGI